MKIELKDVKENPINLFRRVGYVFQRREGEKFSFIRSLARAGYPRFHIYANMSGQNLQISLHLDQKRETYGQATRHHGEYEDEGPLRLEAERIKSVLI